MDSERRPGEAPAALAGLLMPTVLLACAALPPFETPYDRGRFTLDVANDDFGSGVDEAFTSGVEAIFRVTPADRFALSSLDAGLRRLRIVEYWSLTLGHEIHTPALLQVTDLDVLRNDRRYVGWVYGALQAELALAHSPFLDGGQSFYRIELTFGSTGPRTETEALQRYWHAFIRDVLDRRRLPEDPKGWAVYQVPNHWGVNLEVAQEAEMLRWSSEDAGIRRATGADLGFRIATIAEARVGNMFVDAAAGAILRAGLLPHTVFDELSIPGTFGGKRADIPVAIYGFVSGRVVGVLHDTLLDGPPGAEGLYPERNHGLARLEAGFVLRFSAVEFAFRHVTRSPDLAEPPPGGVWIQNWGRITLSFAFY